ncbi:MAG: glycine oxidase ThiO, partial [Planctomycetota bacterium]
MNPTSPHYDVLIGGGGAIGLSLAWELSGRGAKVCLVEREQPGRQASWAGAGMIPPGPKTDRWPSCGVMAKLAGLSDQLHADWSQRLKDLTGVDNGYRRCGAVYLEAADAAAPPLGDHAELWSAWGVEHLRLDRATLVDIEPGLDSGDKRIDSGVLLPGEAQIRNPRHVRGLQEACRMCGVSILSGVAAHRLDVDSAGSIVVHTDAGTFGAERFCIATGCWSSQLAQQLAPPLPIRPVRGQIAMIAGPPGHLKRNVNVGPRYLVPRDDGRILIGSTEEEAGFAAHTTAEAIADLRRFAAALAPKLAEFPLERSWAGLRPATPDGMPYLGRLADWPNVWIAAGHFRAGLQLSPATAVIMADLMTG